MSSDWSSMLCDLLCTIVLKVDDCEDFVHFSAVCRSWNRACSLVKPKWSPRLPWLLLAENKEDNPNCFRRLFNLSRNKCYRAKLPETSDARCWGSPYGWVVVIDLKGQLYLLNPVTRARLCLPPQSTMPNQVEFDENHSTRRRYDECIRSNFIDKAIVLKFGHDDILVVAIHGVHDIGAVAFARPGDRTWTQVLTHKDNSARDVLGCDDRRIYILYHDGSIGYCDIGGARNSESIVALDYLKFRSPDAICDRLGATFHTLYLVKSFDKLLLILRYKDLESVTYSTANFEVFQLDVANKEWKQLNSLCGITLFVGDSNSMCISTPLNGNCRSNCIYFTDDEDQFWELSPNFGGTDMGVFDMETKTVEKFYNGEDIHSELCTPLWFMPNP